LKVVACNQIRGDCFPWDSEIDSQIRELKVFLNIVPAGTVAL